MFSRNTRTTTYLFLGIIMITVAYDLFVRERSFSYISQTSNAGYMTADASQSTRPFAWFWKE